MKTSTVTKPAEHLLTRLVDQAEKMAQDEPAKTVAAAVGAGILLHIVPLRFLVAGATAVTLTMLRPALLTLGLIKAFELCISQSEPE